MVGVVNLNSAVAMSLRYRRGHGAWHPAATAYAVARSSQARSCCRGAVRYARRQLSARAARTATIPVAIERRRRRRRGAVTAWLATCAEGHFHNRYRNPHPGQPTCRRADVALTGGTLRQHGVPLSRITEALPTGVPIEAILRQQMPAIACVRLADLTAWTSAARQAPDAIDHMTRR
jgi:hypothetical protein